MDSPDTTADSTNYHPEKQLIGFSPTSNVVLTMSSTGSTQCILPIQSTSRSSNTVTLSGSCYSTEESTTTASAIQSSQLAQKFPRGQFNQSITSAESRLRIPVGKAGRVQLDEPREEVSRFDQYFYFAFETSRDSEDSTQQ